MRKVCRVYMLRVVYAQYVVYGVYCKRNMYVCGVHCKRSVYVCCMQAICVQCICMLCVACIQPVNNRQQADNNRQQADNNRQQQTTSRQQQTTSSQQHKTKFCLRTLKYLYYRSLGHCNHARVHCRVMQLYMGTL